MTGARMPPVPTLPTAQVASRAAELLQLLAGPDAELRPAQRRPVYRRAVLKVCAA